MRRHLRGLAVVLAACDPPKEAPTETGAVPPLESAADSLPPESAPPDSAPACPEGQPCDDGDACTTGDACDAAGACLGEAVSCDDGDACTTDACVAETGACEHQGWSGAPLDLYDLDAIRDPSTLDLELLDTDTTWEGLTPIEVTEIRYTSWASDGCALSPIRIEAYVARPTDTTADLPGLAVAHGLGGFAEAGSAATPAGQLGVVAIAWSGPGQGSSEGTGSTPDHLFDVLDSPRDSWFWEHAVAGMRALTVLESWDGVDPTRMGVTGYSAGALASLTINGVDDRVDSAFPVSGTGHLDLAIQATPNPGWELDLLEAMTPPRDAARAEWSTFEAALDPKNYLASATGDVLLVTGAQDQFFPINSAVATYNDLVASGVDARILTIQDWDHGWFTLFDSGAAQALAEEDLAFWFDHSFGADPGLSELPPQPDTPVISPWTCFDEDTWLVWSCALVAATLPAPTGYDVSDVSFHFSADGALTWASWNLGWDEDLGLWWAEVGTLDGSVYSASNLAFYSQFTFQDGALGQRVTLTSAASLPPGFSPTIIPITGPLP